MKKLFKCLSLFFCCLFALSLASCDKSNDKPSGDGLADKYDCISIAKAIEIATAAGETATSEKYNVWGTIVTISNPTYGEMTITDGKDELYIYGTYSADGVKRYSELDDKPIKGDEVVLKGSLKMFKGKAEMGSGWILEFKHVEPDVNPNDYVKMSVAEARNAEKTAKVQVSGVVAQITYANGMIPNGFYLVDNSGSIYIFGEVAAQVSVGNKVTIAGEKTYFIQEKEIESANKFGYEGSCQLKDPILLENDNGTTDFDKTWIEDKTIREIMNTPVTENITTSIYKVNALVKKEPNTGFTNYYFNDLDEKTGSYVYTMCNGNDFAWIDPFDGKICTVYLSVINAKSTSTGCLWRFLPIKIIDENFKFNVEDAPAFAVEYYGIDQFESSYIVDPQLSLLTSVSSELLGFENVKLSYSSSNQDAIYFEEKENEVIMHTKNYGIAVITITGTYNEKKASQEVIIKYRDPQEIEALTVKEAINAKDQSEVVVKGVIAGGVVNKKGFYLIDETGVIAVIVNEESILKTIKLGQMVIVKGLREQYGLKDGSANAGQSSITNATIEANLYGEHEYSKNTFDSTKDMEYLYNLDATEDHTTEVYVINAKVVIEQGDRFSIIRLDSEDGSVTLTLYCSGASQYSFLNEFENQVVSLEIMPCNWNDKSHYKFYVLSATGNGKTIVNNYNFEN